MSTVTYTVERIPVERTLALRKAVLRPHLSDGEPFSLDDDRLPTTLAFGAIGPDHRVLSVARLSPEPPPFAERTGPGWRIRGMATSPDFRNLGIGTAVLRAVVDHIAAGGGGILWANARLAALGLYERAGMRPWGDTWEEPDIGPHVVMWREIPDAQVQLSSELSLTEWRREVAEMYAEVRATADPAVAHLRWCERRDRLFREHPQSPLGSADPMRVTGVPYWPYDPSLRFALPVVPVSAAAAARYSIATGAEEVTRIRQLGWVELSDPVGGRLAIWWLEQYGGGIFVPFRDATAGSSTYGAGRYALDTAKGADLGLDNGHLVLDFNFSYHPSCRYDAAWQCPLAPPENVLDAAIEAGERL